MAGTPSLRRTDKDRTATSQDDRWMTPLRPPVPSPRCPQDRGRRQADAARRNSLAWTGYIPIDGAVQRKLRHPMAAGGASGTWPVEEDVAPTPTGSPRRVPMSCAGDVEAAGPRHRGMTVLAAKDRPTSARSANRDSPLLRRHPGLTDEGANALEEGGVPNCWRKEGNLRQRDSAAAPGILRLPDTDREHHVHDHPTAVNRRSPTRQPARGAPVRTGPPSKSIQPTIASATVNSLSSRQIAYLKIVVSAVRSRP